MVRATLRERGQLTLPSEVRVALGLREGDEVVFEMTAQGVYMRGMTLVPTDQTWFWTASWQAGERQASAEIAAGAIETFADADAFLDSLDD